MRPWSNPERMPSSRLSLRLGQLPHAVLAELAALLCSDNPSLQATAEECMAAYNPLPQEMVERVLLSPDLVPSILGPLETGDGAAAAVCSQWLAGWKATNEAPWPRRRLKQVPLELPEELAQSVGQLGEHGSLKMASTPDGRLLVHAGSELRILNRGMRVLQTVPECYFWVAAATDDSIFFIRVPAGDSLYRSTYDRTIVAEYQLDGDEGVVLSSDVAISPGGLFFCVLHGEEDEIIALDAQTMQLRSRFGRGLLSGAEHMCVNANELYVCDTINARLQVFSLAGEHRRSIVGEWQFPNHLCFVNDRMYLHVDPSEEDDDAGQQLGLGSNVYRRRILVLSLEGDVLQVFTHPTEPTAEFLSICCFDDKLLVSYRYDEDWENADPYGRTKYAHGMLAFEGV